MGLGFHKGLRRLGFGVVGSAGGSIAGVAGVSIPAGGSAGLSISSILSALETSFLQRRHDVAAGEAGRGFLDLVKTLS